jgi:hypothetical protein
MQYIAERIQIHGFHITPQQHLGFGRAPNRSSGILAHLRTVAAMPRIMRSNHRTRSCLLLYPSSNPGKHRSFWRGIFCWSSRLRRVASKFSSSARGCDYGVFAKPTSPCYRLTATMCQCRTKDEKSCRILSRNLSYDEMPPQVRDIVPSSLSTVVPSKKEVR